MTTIDDNDIKNMILRRMPPESVAFHAFQEEGHLDIPRDVFQRLFWEDGHDEALRLCTHPDRPFQGIAFWDQPRNRMDTWERFLAQHRTPRPGA